MDSVDVLILGHSFVRRLRDDLTGSWSNLGFDLDSVRVHCVGKGGSRVRDISSMSTSISEIHPKVVLLQIGGNDFDSVDHEDIKDRLASDLLSIAQWLRAGFGVTHVGIMQLFYRAKTRSIAVSLYNRGVDFVNSNIKLMCDQSEGCFYWRHKGLKTAAFVCLNKDGVHLSPAGLRKFKYSVRGAILQGIRLAKGSNSDPRDLSI
ncbi:uncharacterized protein LOC117320799 [Pecten maximus]|uniref:uncharacterized protein LOC117320799 n=1 Tax=Pecten maximus TaxID=6579 RepID=UPI0014591582|nr:uncharacterized protein LOC117320799 [Pecten maximus]